MKDSIDFGSMDIPKLFRKLLIPTVLGMIFSAIFIITDGIFVGNGIGSDALAAVNITAPLFLINTGVALMFGIGASVVASIHLSQGKVKVARINITQAVVVSSLLLIAYAAAWTQEQGLDFVCTVPAQPSLFTFFSKNSFTPAFYHLRVPLPAPQAGPVEPLTPQAYGALREELLGNIPHIVHSPGQIAFEGQLHGALYRLDLSHGPACAVVEDWGDHAVVKELLCLPGDEEEGARRISHLCRGRGELRTPCGRAEGLPFGAIRWLHEPPTPWQQLARGYLGLALD